MKRILATLAALPAFIVTAASVDEYEMSNLITMWDGIHNQGTNVAQNVMATSWLDINGQHPFTLTNARFGSQGPRFGKRGGNNGYGRLDAENTAATFQLAKNGTMEVMFFTSVQGKGVVPIQSSAASGIAFGETSGGMIIAGNASAGTASGDIRCVPRTASVVYENGVPVKLYLDGNAVELNGSNDNWGGGSDVTTIGNRTLLSHDGDQTVVLYSIRLYSTELTAQQVAANAAVDRERFFFNKLNPSSTYVDVDPSEGIVADRTILVAANGDIDAAHDEAVFYIGENPGSTVLVKLAAGNYTAQRPLYLVAGEMLVGAGRDKTFIDVHNLGATAKNDPDAIRLTTAGSLLKGVSVHGLVENAGPSVNSGQKTVKVLGGTVDGCRVFNCLGQYYCSGFGIYLDSGLVTNTIVSHIRINNMNASGLGVYVNNGTLVDSEIFEIEGGLCRDLSGQALYVTGNGIVERCRIHDIGRRFTYREASAVYVAGNGTVRNSQIYLCDTSYESGNSTVAAGVNLASDNAKFYYNTVYGNFSRGDASGYSAIKMTKGTAKNNIFHNNNTTSLGPVISGGTFEKNLVNGSVTGYSDNFIAEDPRFENEGALDFHIGAKASAAVEKAEPISGVLDDADGYPRDADKPTIGAYEYVVQAESFDVDILVTQPDWKIGTSPTVELVLSGVTDMNQLTLRWYLDGVEVPSLFNSREPVFENVTLGYHTIRVNGTYAGEDKFSEVVDAIVVRPTKVYVNSTGSGAFPFATPETATNGLAAAYAALYRNAAVPAELEIDEGEFTMDGVILADCPVDIHGAGVNRTKLVGVADLAYLVTLSNDGAQLRDLTIAGTEYERGVSHGGGISIVRGIVNNCVITNHGANISGTIRGSAVSVENGKLLNSLVTECYNRAQYGYGTVAVTGYEGVISNCTVRGCWSNNQTEQYCSGIFARHGLVVDCRILDCGDHRQREYIESNRHSTPGAALLMSTSSLESKPWATVRNCYIEGCSSDGKSVVFIGGGNFESSTVTGCTTSEGVGVVAVSPELVLNNPQDCAVTNVLVWANTGVNLARPEDSNLYAHTFVGYCCFPECTSDDGEGNTAADPLLRISAGEWAISPKGSCFRTGKVLDWMEGATDLLGRSRTYVKDDVVKTCIGCFEVVNDPGLMIILR